LRSTGRPQILKTSRSAGALRPVEKRAEGPQQDQSELRLFDIVVGDNDKIIDYDVTNARRLRCWSFD
jgi:hypothetical protein